MKPICSDIKLSLSTLLVLLLHMLLTVIFVIVLLLSAMMPIQEHVVIGERKSILL